MQVVLSDEEITALGRALDTYLSEIRYAAARMKLERERHDLVELDRTLTNLCSRLGIHGGQSH